MTDMIIAMLNLIGGGNIAGMDQLLDSPQDYNAALYAAVMLVHNTVVKPVTLIVLAIMAVLMLSTHGSRLDGDRDLGIRIIAGTMLKVALVFIAVMVAPAILEAIAEVATTIANGIKNTDFGSGGGEYKMGDAIGWQVIEDLSDGDTVVLVIMLFLPWVMMNIGGAIVFVMVFLRFLQMFILSAFSSLPIAFFAHEDTKQMGVGYLKSYASVALSGAIMILGVMLYQVLVLGYTQTSMNGELPQETSQVMEWAASKFLIFIVAPIVLIIIMFKAHSLAKNLVGDA